MKSLEGRGFAAGGGQLQVYSVEDVEVVAKSLLRYFDWYCREGETMFNREKARAAVLKAFFHKKEV